MSQLMRAEGTRLPELLVEIAPEHTQGSEVLKLFQAHITFHYCDAAVCLLNGSNFISNFSLFFQTFSIGYFPTLDWSQALSSDPWDNSGRREVSQETDLPSCFKMLYSVNCPPEFCQPRPRDRLNYNQGSEPKYLFCNLAGADFASWWLICNTSVF